MKRDFGVLESWCALAGLPFSGQRWTLERSCCESGWPLTRLYSSRPDEAMSTYCRLSGCNILGRDCDLALVLGCTTIPSGVLAWNLCWSFAHRSPSLCDSCRRKCTAGRHSSAPRLLHFLSVAIFHWWRAASLSLERAWAWASAWTCAWAWDWAWTWAAQRCLSLAALWRSSADISWPLACWDPSNLLWHPCPLPPWDSLGSV